MADPSRQDALTIARIVRVNHAGEFGAIRIYSAQILFARRLWPDCVPSLSEMLGHERTHCAAFRAAMPARRSRPCIWACTAAVEAAVHRHLDDQLFFLANRDHDLHGIILAIREEELAHLHHAEEQLKSPGPALNFLRSLISIATDVLIWLSTWGDSSRMTRALKAAKRTS